MSRWSPGVNVIKIENWAVVYLPTDPHCSPERKTKHLNGRVQNHPQRLAVGIVTTSSTVRRRGGLVITKNGSFNELGKIRAEFAAQFPGVTEWLLKTLPEI
jgi:hypothetical protein